MIKKMFRRMFPKPVPFPSHEASLQVLKERGFGPRYVVDVGAYRGSWTEMFKRFFPSAKVIMVEPQGSKAPFLNKVCAELNDVVYSDALVGAEHGKNVRFVEMETGSSVFEESSDYERQYSEKTQTTLDHLLQNYPEFARLDFLKLDVQGYELEALKGASKTLQNTELVLMEASFIPINKGCPLIGEVIAFMSARDFRLLDFCSQIRRNDGALWQTDLLFIKNNSKHLPQPHLLKSE